MEIVKAERKLINPDEYQKLMKNGNFGFYLQPKVNLKTGVVTGAEALARCVLDNGKVVLPADFIPMMEENGFIPEFDMFMVRSVCEHIAARISKGLKVVSIAVNLSRFDLQSDDTALKIHMIAEQCKVPVEFLEFELAESLFNDDYTLAKQLADALRNFGYRVSIDDFGSGYAGLKLWHELEFDIVKLDRRFLLPNSDEIHNDVQLPGVMQTAIKMNTRVICEGVESEDDCRKLIRYGCELAQGFYFSKPIPTDEFYKKLTDINGCFDTPYIKKNEAEKKVSIRNFIKPDSKNRLLAAVLILLLGILCIIIPTVYDMQSRKVSVAYEQRLLETLKEDTVANVSQIESEVTDVRSVLRAFSALISDKDELNNEDIEQYINAMSEGNSYVMFQYLDLNELNNLIKNGIMMQRQYDELKNGNSSTSGLRKSSSTIEYDHIVIGMPVFIKEHFSGCLRAILDVSMFVSYNNTLASYGSVQDVMIVDMSGKIVKYGKHTTNVKDLSSAMDYFSEGQITGKAVYAALKNGTEYCARISDKDEYFIALSPIDNIPYFYVIIVDAEDNTEFIDGIVFEGTENAVAIVVLVMIYFGFVMMVFLRSDRKAREAAKRWGILEQFSDTALFVYDCRKDRLEISHNAGALFRTAQYEINDYLANIGGQTTINPSDLTELSKAFHPKDGQQYNEVRIRLKHPTEDRYNWCLLQFRYEYEHGKVVAAIGKILDIDTIQSKEQELSAQAQRDGLTKIYNKITFEGKVARRMARYPKGVLIVIDVDGFKQINDLFGHLKGDRVLQHIASCLLTSFPEGKQGRIGGDEFAVYIHDEGAIADIDRRIALFKREVSDYKDSDMNNELTVSIGMACFPTDGLTYRQLFSAADDKMYCQKKSSSAKKARNT